MKIKNLKVLPKTLPGTVHMQFVRCGKKNCRCSRDELHGPYFYHFVRIDGRLRKRYVKPTDVEAVQLACLARRLEQQTFSSLSQKAWDKFREIREQIRSVTEEIDRS